MKKPILYEKFHQFLWRHLSATNTTCMVPAFYYLLLGCHIFHSPKFYSYENLPKSAGTPFEAQIQKSRDSFTFLGHLELSYQNFKTYKKFLVCQAFK
jgi:hypothetical protein